MIYIDKGNGAFRQTRNSEYIEGGESTGCEAQMDYAELEKWYDGYQIGGEQSMFNPNSVMQAIGAEWCCSYWAATGSFEAVTGYIDSNYDGLRDDIVGMLAGGRAKVDSTGFQNDLF